MKCYSWLLILILSLSNFAWANSLSPVSGEQTITNGDIIEAVIESDKSTEELNKLVGKKITNIFYVLKYKERDNLRLFEIIVTNPPQKVKQEDNKFLVRGFKYNFDKEKVIQNFIVFDDEYTLQKKGKNHLVSIALVLIFLITGLFLFKFLRKKILMKKLRKEERKKVVEAITTANSRDKLEQIVKLKKLFYKHFELYEDDFKAYERELNLIQYKKEWAEDEYKQLLVLKENLERKLDNNGV